MSVPNPGLLMQVATAHRASVALFTAADLDVFTALADGPKSASDVARHVGITHVESLRLVLEMCVQAALLERDDAGLDTYRNTPTTDTFLVRGRPSYIGAGLQYAADLYPAWGRLTDLVRTGRAPLVPETILGDDPEKTRHFVLAMHQRAQGIGTVLPAVVNLAGCSRLLDVGGGPGTYSMKLIAATPGLQSTILDLPGVLAVTRGIVDQEGFGNRIHLRPGNYLTSDFGSGYDAVLLSGMMHRETAADCQLLLRKAAAALNPGGRIVVSDVFFDDARKTTPPFAVQFALHMMLTSDHGSAHAKTEMADWMRQVGCREVDVRPLPPPNPHTVLFGRLP
jgi:2-polyprenyl-3-methyl-5-hydroxy-6-metoxy-1,4-benzoquinol methylase